MKHSMSGLREFDIITGNDMRGSSRATSYDNLEGMKKSGLQQSTPRRLDRARDYKNFQYSYIDRPQKN